MPTRTVALFFLFTLATTAPMAEIFTWTDGDGVVHFTDRRPAGERPDTVSPPAPSVMPMGSNVKAAEAIRKSLGTPQRDGPSARARDVNRARQQKRCEQYREKLEKIQSQLRAGYSNAHGNRLRARRRDLSGRLSRECILG
ncbi:protein of unknown function [Marinobacter daqiaonensis]|uniref:DUF4124 domain-containing protein n=1 Tax=Marinobacter daqiaonensis TaxID=650891 RepID=A0A1I6HTH7_9GAMM|nr:DUF4124 domain-containing protein [Marinobacter daqiaonensis]SFR57733.1 protein of unknown function [Marinobacter daqiaonensis]